MKMAVLIDKVIEQFRERREEPVRKELSQYLHGAALESAVKKKLDDECAERRKELEKANEEKEA